jgi:alpha-D-xyloside xylohydrolase
MFPAHAAFPSGLDGEAMRQLYGLLLQRITERLFHIRDRRTYGLVRASGAFAAPFPYALYSDLYSHREFVRALVNSGFSGLLWCPEIRSAKDGEEWVRRMQTVCFSPLAMLNAWASGTKPWSFPEVEPIVRKYIELRMRLLPYFYAAFARYRCDGTPPFRALALEPGAASDPALRECDDQYLAGDSLLVAPVFAGERARDVLLPPGAWHDFETGERFEGGQRIRVECSLETLPLFARDGAIIPLMPLLLHAPNLGEAMPLEIRHYGTLPGSFDLFDDDGETYAYERGKFRWRRLEVTLAPDGTRRGTFSPIEPGWQSAYGEVTWDFFG